MIHIKRVYNIRYPPPPPPSNGNTRNTRTHTTILCDLFALARYLLLPLLPIVIAFVYFLFFSFFYLRLTRFNYLHRFIVLSCLSFDSLFLSIPSTRIHIDRYGYIPSNMQRYGNRYIDIDTIHTYV